MRKLLCLLQIHWMVPRMVLASVRVDSCRCGALRFR